VTLHPSAVAQSSPTHFESLLANGIKGFKFVSGGRITFTPDWNQADEHLQVPDLTKIEIGATAVHPPSINFTLDPSYQYVRGMPPPPTDQTTLPIMQIGFDPLTQQWTLVIWAKLTNNGAGVFSVAYLQVDSTSAITGLKSTGFWPGDLPARPTLLMNRVGGYVDATVNAGLNAPISCVSATAGDFDNDMDIDLYLACRTGASNIANILYENLGDGTFQKVTNAGGAVGPVGVAIASGAGTADSVISGDYDVDGFLDLFVTNGLNLQPRGLGGPNKLFHNNGNSNHWVEVDLVGTTSDSDATGAKVYATAGGVEQLRVQNGAYHRWSQDARRAHFGLAGNATVDLRVVWPGNTEQTFKNMPANKLYRITENDGIVAVTPGAAPAYPCGAPATNGAVDKGVFVWRDCATGQWSMKVWSANTAITYQGTITSTSNFTTVTPQSVETNDVLDTSNPKQIGFTFINTGTGSDGVNFKLPDGANACLDVAAPTGQQVFIGPFRTPVTQPLDLETQQDCSGGN
jgi:ASPIC and UnbV/FG-GAP-like repeat